MKERSHERGALMVGLMAAVAILMILSTVGFQAWQDVIRRDREAEMIFRAQEIVRALRRYQKDQGALPIEFDALAKSGSRGQYFLRRKYTDPLVKDGKWGFLFLAPGGGIYDPNAEEVEAGALPGEQGGAGDGGAFGAPGSRRSRLNPEQPGAAQRPGVGAPNPGSGFGIGAGGSAGDQGLPIAGVRTLCKDKPFRVFREQTTYDKWLFTVLDDDLLGPIPGQPNARVPGGAGQPGVPGQPGAGGRSAFGGSAPARGGSGFGSSPIGSGKTPSSPPEDGKD